MWARLAVPTPYVGARNREICNFHASRPKEKNGVQRSEAICRGGTHTYVV